MPILEIEIVSRPEEELPDGLAAAIASSAGRIFETPPGQTWVKLRPLPRVQYAEDGSGLAEDVFPVFVSVLKRYATALEEMEPEIDALTRAIARACNRPEQNVHILYLPAAAGRLAFGGRLVTD